MNRSEAFWDRVAEKYSSKPVSDEKVYQEKLALGRWLGILPAISFFSREKLSETIRDAGYDVAQSCNPGGGISLFVVARKPGPNI